MKIPKQLQNEEFRFVLLGKWDDVIHKKGTKPLYKGKAPFEKDWANNGYKYNDLKLLNHLHNFGVIGGYGSLRILDIDDKELAKEFLAKTSTYTVQTGGGGMHFYFISDYDKNHVLVEEKGELRAKNYQVVSAPCRHPSGKYYKVIKDIPIKKISSDDLYNLIKPYLREEQEVVVRKEKGLRKIKIIKNKESFKIGEILEEDEDGARRWVNSGYAEYVDIDTSASGLEYRRVLALIREGKTREQIYEMMEKYYKRWAASKDDYRNLTFNKAYDYYLLEQEKETKKETPIDNVSLNILKDPELFENINKEFDKRIEGEEKSRKAIFLSLCYIWVDGSDVPIDTFVSSESSAGKSYVCKNVIKIFPKELVEYRTKITPEAFTYWHTKEEDWNWNGKICYLEDVSQAVLDSPTFKVMCSEGSIATIVINQKAVDLEVKGKPVILVTTASTNPKAEVLNRFQIVSMDESAKQTEAIVFRIAKDEELKEYDENLINALKFLKRKKIKIDYGEKIAQFLRENYDFKSLRLRRDFSRLKDLIKCSATLHQYQRKKDEKENILANEEDYRIARECINYIQTHTFRGLIHRLRKAYDCCKELKEFTAKEIHSKYPFVNQKMWYIYLNDLAEKNMLSIELRKEEDVKQKVKCYILNEDKVFELPEFDKLPQNITNDTIVTKDTKVTNVTKDKVTNVTNVTILPQNPKKNEEYIPKFPFWFYNKMPPNMSKEVFDNLMIDTYDTKTGKKKEE